MASKRPLLPRNGHIRLLVSSNKLQSSSICPFCSLTPAARAQHRPRRDVVSRRYQSTAANADAKSAPNARLEVERTLLELQTRIPNLMNLSRVQLALQGLRQAPGDEAIRVAILGFANDADTGIAARRILRTLLADPLQDEEAWEQELENYELDKPLIVRVGPVDTNTGSLSISKDNPIQELHVSSPSLNGLNLELLLMNVTAPYGAPVSMAIQALEDAVLVPTVDIPSAESRVSPVTTPVHQALLVAEGLAGAVNVSALPISATEGSVLAAVDMKGLSKDQLGSTLNVIDVSLAEQGIQLFRQGPQNGMAFEKLWFASNVSTLATWLKSGISTTEQETKPAVRQLLASILRNTLASIQNEEARSLAKDLETKFSLPAGGALNKGLAEWAQRAHAELQDELDLAFTGRRWRKLGWWKLFWRVDDVAMLTNEMLGQRFMPTAEQELVYLTGRIAGLDGRKPQYPQPILSTSNEKSLSGARKLGSGELAPAVTGTIPSGLPKWPGHIAFTRRYLQNETVPALQSLAQKLVIQSLGTSSVTTSLAALLYMSSYASTLYEAGAVAALGIVYSLSRMQKKWETARGFWEGEAREEGRKAVRAAEESVAEALKSGESPASAAEGAEVLQKARELVAEAEDALSRMK